MGAEQSQPLVLQKERAVPVEQSVGVRVASSTLLRDGMVAVNLNLTCSRIFIVGEGGRREGVISVRVPRPEDARAFLR